METQKLIEMLQRLGFNGTEAKVYITLLSGNSFKASEVAIRSGVPRQKVYDALKNLSHKGFCTYKPGKVQKYSAADPSTSINDYISTQKEQEIIRESTALDLLLKLEPMYEKSKHQINPLEFIEIVRGRNQIDKIILKLENETKSEFMGFIKAPYVKPPPKIHVSQLKKRGVRMRGIYEIDDWKGYDFLEQQIKDGIEARFVKQLPMKMAIYDKNFVLLDFHLPTETPTYTTVVIEHPYFIQLLEIAFNSVWEKAVPLIDKKKLKKEN
jgi:sugar-specific transcriptional regulator TrmB